MTRDLAGVLGRPLGNLVAALLAACVGVSCASSGARSRDYVFGVTVFVVDEAGVPIPGATVSLATRRAVFEAVVPVTSVDRQTDPSGGCVFMYTAHQPHVEYRVKVQKAGFLAQELTGVASPSAHHRIELRRADQAEGAAEQRGAPDKVHAGYGEPASPWPLQVTSVLCGR